MKEKVTSLKFTVFARWSLCFLSVLSLFPLGIASSLFSLSFHSQLVREDAGRDRGAVVAAPADEHDAVVCV